jgi:peptidoglycan/LPS O-acetylase OafA/YrhL
MKQELQKFKNTLLGTERDRVFGLDIVRAVAILLVLFSHSRGYLKPVIGEAAELFSFGGYLGVELFFVLSGFLIGGILIKILDHDGGRVTFKNVKDFWVRRWFRTLPNYFLVLLVNIIALSIISQHIVINYKYFFFLQNLLTPISDNLNYGQSWSLTIEEWFYLLTPIILYLLIRINKIERKKAILWGILIIIIFIPILKIGYYYTVDFFLHKAEKITFVFYRSVVILRLDSLLYGVLIAYFNFYYKDWITKQAKVLFGIGLFALLGIVFYCIRVVVNDNSHTSLTFNILFTSCGSLGLSLLLPFFNKIRSVRPSIVTRFIVVTSVISYSLYLIHFSFISPVVNYLKIGGIYKYLLFWLLCYLISSINFVLFENRMTKLREKITK